MIRQNAPSLIFTGAISTLALAIAVSTSPEPTFMDLPDWLSGIGDFMTGSAAIAAAVVGIRSLNAWRAETIGQRKVAVAEEVLAAFYQVKDIIHAARSPLVLVGEMQPEEGVPDEIATNAHYAPLRRLQRDRTFLSEFWVQRYRFAAVFGLEAAKPFDEINRVLNEINAAVESLVWDKGANEIR
ncbi:MAG TPA: hypothetical protein VGU24_00055 [Microvirga sp.]|jgi:hypothetical protein|nr:hypothetical protein [Microvirga sp.]